jgi:hypothetical protein
MQQKRCLAIIDGRECGLELVQENPADESILTQYRCGLGHRTHIMAERKPSSQRGAPARARPKSNS